MIVRNEDFEVLSGQTVRYDRKAESGNVTAMNFCAHCYGWLWNDPATPGIKVVARGHARQHRLGRADRKYLDRQQGRLGEDRPGTGQFPETGGGPDAVVRRLDPAQSRLKNRMRNNNG